MYLIELMANAKASMKGLAAGDTPDNLLNIIAGLLGYIEVLKQSNRRLTDKIIHINKQYETVQSLSETYQIKNQVLERELRKKNV